MAHSLWVDMYGDGITRDLEPTVEDGGRIWELFQSCMRVFRSKAPSCSNKTEACCMRGDDDPESNWVNVWSLAKADGTDMLLTIDPNERRQLTSGSSWKEICSAAGGATAFCAWNNDPHFNSVAPNASSYQRGPFLLWAGPVSSALSFPCHRCITPTGRHFIARDKSCLGLGTIESTLGYVAQRRSSNIPRSLRLCRSKTGMLYHSLDATCSLGDQQLQFLGFVH